MRADERMKALRAFLKDTRRKEFDFSSTDQNRGVPAPPVEKPCREGAVIVDLPPPLDDPRTGTALKDAMKGRRSRRSYAPGPLSLAEVSFLLWAVQGVRQATPGRVFRTVPSAGNRHALETYLAVTRVEDLANGLYRYLPLRHALVLEREDQEMGPKLVPAALGQRYPAEAAATFIWTAVPYRMEWRYGEVSHKVIALDAGHACQNLYLACEAIGAGTVAIAAYDQEGMDKLLGVDGIDEFAIYLAPVGRKDGKGEFS